MVLRHRPVRHCLDLARRERPGIAGDDATEDAAHIDVDGADRSPEGDRRHGPRGIRPDTGKCLELGHVRRELPAVLLNDDPRGSPQGQRAPVVAKALPRAKHVRRGRGSQRLDRREALHETFPVRRSASGLGLLGHRLRDEDRVWIAGVAESEGPAMLCVPGKDGLARSGRHARRGGHELRIAVAKSLVIAG